MVVCRRPGLLRQRNPGVPSGVMVCLRVLARTGRLDSWRPCASFPPSSGSTAVLILCVARWRSARGMIEWLCTQERLKPEVAIVFGATVRYRRATVGIYHDGAHPDNSTHHAGAVRPHTGFMGSLFFISPRTGHGSSQVFEKLPAFSCISWACAFRAGDDPSIFFQWALEADRSTSVMSRRAGSPGISWLILFLVKKTRVSPFVKRVKAPQILGETVRA
jgi:hypothetical protein